MPVLADHRNVEAAELVSGQDRLARQSHGCAEREQVRLPRAHHSSHAFRIGQFPIAPDELVKSAGEMGFRDGRPAGGGGEGARGGNRTRQQEFAASHCSRHLRIVAQAGVAEARNEFESGSLFVLDVCRATA